MDNMSPVEIERLTRLNQSRLKDKLTSANLILASNIVTNIATGGVGKVVRNEAQKKLKGSIIGLADRAAEFYEKNNSVENISHHQEKKLQGLGFWIVFGIVIFQEILNIALDLSILLSILTTISSLLVTFIVYFYLATQGVSLSSRRLAMWVVSIIIELIPFVNILPAFPIMLLVMKIMENNEFLKNKVKLTEGIIK